MKLKLIPLAALAAALVACGATPPAPVPVAYDDDVYAAAVCVDQADWTRVPDPYCPIGDEPVPGHPYQWVYDEYRADDTDIDIVLVGYRVPRDRFVDRRPARVATPHIDRGRFPEKLPPGAAPSTSAKVQTESARRSTIARGGLGTTNRASTAPTPNRDLGAAAPGRTQTAPKVDVPAPKALPKAPTGPRKSAPTRKK